MTTTAPPFRRTPDGLRLTVRLTPKSDRDALGGGIALGEQSALVVRVRAVPEKGAANAALIRLVASRLGVARSDVALLSGARARLKTLAIRGDADALSARLHALLQDTDPQ